MPRAIRLTEQNVDGVIMIGAFNNFDLSHLLDEMACNADDGWATYLITDGDFDLKNVTFTCLTSPDFHKVWKFIGPEDDDGFAHIARIRT